MMLGSSSSSWKSTGVGTSGVRSQFPVGLRVLVVDDDPTCLMVLEKMLKSCNYEVTMCRRAETGLSRLREKKDGYDIVLSDVHMPDMDGFKLLEHIGLEMDIPVIMMSGDDSRSVVMKGVTHGACDYLIKPIRIEVLRNIWQHVVRGRKHDFDLLASADRVIGNKAKRSKKRRFVWSIELHQQFLACVDHLGIDKAVPKKILEMMNVPGMTRENVASHLQQYRIYLTRLSEELSSVNAAYMEKFWTPRK